MPSLVDKFGRKHDYLRISLLERCNLRCHYCMPEDGVPLRDKNEFMSQEELFQIVEHFIDLGITKIRLTGGEPLLKKNFSEILAKLGKYPIELALTTNAILLHHYWEQLESVGLKKLNISIDSLCESTFNQITRRKFFDKVITNIETAIARGFETNLNVVLIKGENDHEVEDFIDFTKSNKTTVRFIEFMPFDGNNWDKSKTVKSGEIIKGLSSAHGEDFIKVEDAKNSTSRNYKIRGYEGSFGFISTVSNPFCDSCNRIRLTADGKIKNCLFGKDEIDLLSAIRAKKDIKELIADSINTKHEKLGGIKDFSNTKEHNNRMMTTIGG